MSAIWQWVFTNPQAFRSFTATLCAMLFKLILQLSGRSDQLAHWNDAASQTLDIAVYILMGAGVIMGAYHASRGPALTSINQAAAIVAALAPAPVTLAVEQVKTIVEEVAAPKAPAVSEMPGSHRF
jgi:uncharacterized membrane protein HdeD (DUF308 family)